MEIILLNDYDGLGEAGDLVNVKINSCTSATLIGELI